MGDRPPHDPHATLPPPVRITLDPTPTPSPANDTGTNMPRTIGRFAVRGFLDAGTFGTVYRALVPQLDREVALKVAPAVGQSPDRMQRFRREARTAAGLRHPHIVPLFEAGEADGRLYLASAYVKGTTLADALHERGAFAPRDAAAIAQELAVSAVTIVGAVCLSAPKTAPTGDPPVCGRRGHRAESN